MKHLTDHEIQSYFHDPAQADRRRIEKHISHCSDCRKQLLLYEKLGEIVSSASSNPTPKGFEKAVMEKLKISRRLNRRADMAVCAVACIGIVLIGLIILITPQLKQTVADCLTGLWLYGSEVATTIAFGTVLLTFFAGVDWLAIRRLRWDAGRDGPVNQ